MAVRAVAEVAAAEGTAAEGAATEGAATEGPTAGLMQTAACHASPPAQIAAEHQLLTAVHLTPAEQAPIAEQPTASRQSAPDSVQLIPFYAAIHRAYQQHWSTVSECEQGGMHDQFSQADRPDRNQSWGAQLYYQAPGRYRGQFSTREADQLQATKVAAWEVAAGGCRQALLQLQKAKSAQQGSSAAACTPEQAISQHHPLAALEFRLQTQGIAAAEGVVKAAGIAEKAQIEVERRVKASCQSYHRSEAESTMIRSWLNRARQTAEMAQALEQAAIESVEVLKSVLCNQSWDHRLVSERHNERLRQMELDPIPTNVTLTKQVESEQKRLQAFMTEVQTKEREELRKMTKEKERVLRLGQRSLEAISIDANA